MDFFKAIISKLLKKTGSQEKGKLVEYLIIIVIVGIIAIIAGSTFFGGSDNKGNEAGTLGQNNSSEVVSDSVLQDSGSALEKKLEKFLSQIEGAGKVTVMVTYVSGNEIVPAEDVKRTDENTQERDNAGGTRNNENSDYQSNIAYEEQGGTKKPIIIKEILPQVKGVVVIAAGADNAIIRNNLMKAVQVLMDVPLHKIHVLKKG